MTQQPPTDDYATNIQLCLAEVKKIVPDDTPVEDLERMAKKAGIEGYADGRSAAAATRAATKEPKDPNAPPEQPPATSTTGTVWLYADEVAKSLKIKFPVAEDFDWKPFRKALMDKCEVEGINSATAATQYSKYRKARNV